MHGQRRHAHRREALSPLAWIVTRPACTVSAGTRTCNDTDTTISVNAGDFYVAQLHAPEAHTGGSTAYSFEIVDAYTPTPTPAPTDTPTPAETEAPLQYWGHWGVGESPHTPTPAVSSATSPVLPFAPRLGAPTASRSQRPTPQATPTPTPTGTPHPTPPPSATATPGEEC